MAGADHDLDRLRGLKRRALDLASSHLRALDPFYLSRDLHSLERLRARRTTVGGFASVLTDPGDRRDGSGRASLATTAACVRSLLVCPEVKPATPTTRPW